MKTIEVGFLVLATVVAVVYGNCSRSGCDPNQCCTGISFFSSCKPLSKQGELCSNSTKFNLLHCRCVEGFICKLDGLIPRCADIGNATTIETTSNTSSGTTLTSSDKTTAGNSTF